MGLENLTNLHTHKFFQSLNSGCSSSKHKMKVLNITHVVVTKALMPQKTVRILSRSTTKLREFSFQKIEVFVFDNWKSYSIESYFCYSFPNSNFTPCLAKFAHADQILSMIRKKKAIG